MKNYFSAIALGMLLVQACVPIKPGNAVTMTEAKKQAEANRNKEVEAKIDSQLLQRLKVYENETQGQNRKQQQGNSPFEVDIRGIVTDTLVSQLRKLDCNIIYPSKQHGTIRAKVNFNLLRPIAALHGVSFIEAALPPLLSK